MFGGCATTSETKFNVDCNGLKTTLYLKENDKFKCKLLGTDYELTIKNIKSDKAIINASEYGLSSVEKNGKISLIDRVKKFNIEKGKKLILATQTTDYTEKITINWE